jgi:integrase
VAWRSWPVTCATCCANLTSARPAKGRRRIIWRTPRRARAFRVRARRRRDEPARPMNPPRAGFCFGGCLRWGWRWGRGGNACWPARAHGWRWWRGEGAMLAAYKFTVPTGCLQIFTDATVPTPKPS